MVLVLQHEEKIQKKPDISNFPQQGYDKSEQKNS